MKIIIIDGNNLIHKVQSLKMAFYENSQNAQLSLIETVMAKHISKDKLIFVFDGYGKFTRNNVVFSEKVTADVVIRKYIEDNYNKKIIQLFPLTAKFPGLLKYAPVIPSARKIFGIT